jgi:hypothetical protein
MIAMVQASLAIESPRCLFLESANVTVPEAYPMITIQIVNFVKTSPLVNLMSPS